MSPTPPRGSCRSCGPARPPTLARHPRMETIMPRRQKPIDELPASETPVIVKVEPTLDTDDLRDFAKKDEAMFKALEAVEREISQQTLSKRPSREYSIPID